MLKQSDERDFKFPTNVVLHIRDLTEEEKSMQLKWLDKNKIKRGEQDGTTTSSKSRSNISRSKNK